jgi:hypothetical protein
MKIWLISALAPVNDVAGPLLLYRHFKNLINHSLKVFTHEYAGPKPNVANWEEYRLNYPKIIKIIPKIFFRKFLFWIGEELLSLYVYFKVRNYFAKEKPDIILTTWFSTFLIPAYKLSCKFNIPLAIICHDDFENQVASDVVSNYLKRRKLTKIYRHAKARFCVAEGMENEFYKRYGAHGDILYPIGGENSKNEIKVRDNSTGKLVFGYLGSISNGAEPLLFFADCLKETEHQLYIYTSGFPTSGPYTTHPNIKNAGFYSDREMLLTEVFTNIDVFIVSQSFDLKDKMFLQTNFPSKLIDMVGIGLPLIIISPPYSSSGIWAKKFNKSNIYISRLNKEIIIENIDYLKKSAVRENYSKEIDEVSRSFFNPQKIHEKLESVLLQIVSHKLLNN